MGERSGGSLREPFVNLQEPGVERTRRHDVLNSITPALCAVMCGAESWGEGETWGRAKEAWLRTFLALPSGIASQDTFGRVFAARDPEQFERGVLAWVVAGTEPLAGEVVAIDGKGMRRSGDAATGRGPLLLQRLGDGVGGGARPGGGAGGRP